KSGIFGLESFSSRDTATKDTPRGAYSFSASTKNGISARQGTHQVAQKFRTTGLPRKSLTRTRLPFISLKGRLTGLESAGDPATGNSAGKRSSAAAVRRKDPLTYVDKGPSSSNKVCERKISRAPGRRNNRKPLPRQPPVRMVVETYYC